MISAFKDRLEKPDVDDVLQSLHLGPDARAEQLEVEFVKELCERFRLKLHSKNESNGVG